VIKFNVIVVSFTKKEETQLDDKKIKEPMEHLNIGEFNRGQSSKLLRKLVEEDKAAYILKNGKPMAVVIPYEKYERMLKAGIDVNDY